MITREQLNSISSLNKLFQNNEYYRTAISTDNTVRNIQNIYKCIKINELYNYLYKHYDILNDIFDVGSDGRFSEYNAQATLRDLHNYMCNQDATAAQTITELKRVRNAVDYKTNELKDKLNNQKPNMLKQAYERASTNYDTVNPSNSQVRQEELNIINEWIDRISRSLLCKKHRDPNTKAVLLIRQASGLAAETTIAVINIMETPNGLSAILVKSGTGERFYIREDTVNEIIATLKGGRQLK